MIVIDIGDMSMANTYYNNSQRRGLCYIGPRHLFHVSDVTAAAAQVGIAAFAAHFIWVTFQVAFTNCATFYE